MATTSLVEWRSWGRAAFEEARAERAPVLLAIGARWCPATAAMMRGAYADPRVADLLDDRFVPVRVDAEARPDIAERYGLGGWPTTAFLTPDGDVLGGETLRDRGADAGSAAARLRRVRRPAGRDRRAGRRERAASRRPVPGSPRSRCRCLAGGSSPRAVRRAARRLRRRGEAGARRGPGAGVAPRPRRRRRVRTAGGTHDSGDGVGRALRPRGRRRVPLLRAARLDRAGHGEAARRQRGGAPPLPAARG